MPTEASDADAPGLVARLALAALCGAAFFAAYGACNAAARDAGTDTCAFLPADSAMPFLPWTIVPYWSLDLLFVSAFLVLRTRAELRMHTARVLLGIGVACTAFLLFPLRCGATRPADTGIWESWFSALGGVDLPYNQAPSLHIILLLIVWHAHLPGIPPRFRPLAYAWGALIGVSTLTTRQHGIIDVVTGLLVGALIVYGVRAAPWFTRDTAGSRTMARRYALLTGLLYGIAAIIAPAGALPALGLGWCATGTGLVALAYAAGCTGVYAKNGGRVHWSAKLLLGPALLFQKIIHRALRERHLRLEPGARITFGPVGGPVPADAALLDLTAEHDTAGMPACARASLPMLDLVTPDATTLRRGAAIIREFSETRPVHVVCALGLERSALVVAAWHLLYGGANGHEEAVARVRALRPGALPHPEKLAALRALTAYKTTG